MICHVDMGARGRLTFFFEDGSSFRQELEMRATTAIGRNHEVLLSAVVLTSQRLDAPRRGLRGVAPACVCVQA